MKWWDDARFGMMVHFGPYALLEGEYKGQKAEYVGEWIQSRFRIPNSEYSQIAKEFNPANFDADAWIKCASDAGMKYIIFTSKHHDGFAMFNSKVSDYNIYNTCGMDLVADLAKACKKYGVKLGIYYSHCLDWHEKDAGGFDAEYSNFGMSWSNDWDYPNNDEKDFDKYFNEKAIPQVKEILTNYGEIALLWFDCPINITEEQAKKLRDAVKSIQPNCMINSRIGFDYGDYYGLGDNSLATSAKDETRETVATLNDTWGYKYFDNNWKTPEEIIKTLEYSVSTNTNFALNIGPKPDGTFPKESIEILKDISKWMSINSPAIHENKATKVFMNTNDYIVTQKDNNLYIHIINNVSNIELVHLKTKIKDAKVLGDIATVTYNQEKDASTDLLITSFNITNGSNTLPIIEIELFNEPEYVTGIIQESKTINLNAFCAAINKTSDASDTNNQGKDDYVIGAAGEKYYMDEITLNEQDIIVNWFDTKNYLTWDFIARKTGKYKVSLITSAVYHSEKWLGGHDVTVEFDNQKMTTVLKNDGDVLEAGEYYKQVKSDIGYINIDKVGKCSINLKANNIIFDKIGLAVVKLVLELN